MKLQKVQITEGGFLIARLRLVFDEDWNIEGNLTNNPAQIVTALMALAYEIDKEFERRKEHHEKADT